MKKKSWPYTEVLFVTQNKIKFFMRYYDFTGEPMLPWLEPNIICWLLVMKITWPRINCGIKLYSNVKVRYTVQLCLLRKQTLIHKNLHMKVHTYRYQYQKGRDFFGEGVHRRATRMGHLLNISIWHSLSFVGVIRLWT